MSIVLAFDPSMRNWGCVVADISNGVVTVLHHETISIDSYKSSKAQQLLEIADETFRIIVRLVKQYKPLLILTELPHGSQSAQGMKSYAFSITILGTICALGIPLKTYSAYDVKHTVGSNTATKKEVVNWVANKHPNLFPLHGKAISVDKYQHVADAIAVIYTHLSMSDMRKHP